MRHFDPSLPVSALVDETKRFLVLYGELREVSRKALKDKSVLVTAASLRVKAVEALEITADRNNLVFQRSGGAAANAGPTEDGAGCVWCGETASLPENARYCDQECFENAQIRGSNKLFQSTHIRAAVFELERGVCQLCGADAHGIYTRIKGLAPSERLNALLNLKNFHLPKSSAGVRRLTTNPEEADFWEADHILPVAEGGGSSGLDNLRTLCRGCHAGETRKLLARLKLGGGGGSSDIRNFFGGSGGGREIGGSENSAREKEEEVVKGERGGGVEGSEEEGEGDTKETVEGMEVAATLENRGTKRDRSASEGAAEGAEEKEENFGTFEEEEEEEEGEEDVALAGEKSAAQLSAEIAALKAKMGIA